MTQTERNNHNRELGKKGEGLISSSLRNSGFWRLKQINLGNGTKCDFIAAHRQYGAYMLEVKTTDENPVIAYSWVSENERKALNEFETLIPGHAFVVGVWVSDVKRAFLILWVDVRDAVCSGCRGSIDMLEFPELQRLGRGWDMRKMGKE
jgi:Holliday junction resolvase